MLIEGHTVKPGVKRHLPQMCCQPGGDGLLIFRDWFCQALEFAPLDAQCDRRAAYQIFPPGCMGKDVNLIAFLRVADRGGDRSSRSCAR